jgi:hypothetical protein
VSRTFRVQPSALRPGGRGPTVEWARQPPPACSRDGLAMSVRRLLAVTGQILLSTPPKLPIMDKTR